MSQTDLPYVLPQVASRAKWAVTPPSTIWILRTKEVFSRTGACTGDDPHVVVDQFFLPFTFSVEIPVPKQGELMQLRTCEEINYQESLGSKYNSNYWQRKSMRTYCEMERQVWMDWLVQLLCLPPQGRVASVVWFIRESYCFTLVELEPCWACCGLHLPLFQHHNLLIHMQCIWTG